MEDLKKDLGQLKKGATVVVTLRQQANVLLMDSSNYRTYAASRGGRFRYTGGLIKKSSARLTVPSNGHWYLAIDLGGAKGRINATIAVEPPPRGNLPEYRAAPERGVSGQVTVRRPLPPESDADFDGRTWDVFLSHANEDKTDVALPLAQALQDRGVSVWLDKAELRIGDSLRRRIDRGLRSSRCVAVDEAHPNIRFSLRDIEAARRARSHELRRAINDRIPTVARREEPRLADPTPRKRRLRTYGEE